MREDGAVEVIGSLQCLFHVHGAVQKVATLPEKVIIRQAATGGGFEAKRIILRYRFICALLKLQIRIRSRSSSTGEKT